MKYKIQYYDEEFDDIDDVIDYCIDEDYHWDDDYFVEWINDNYGSLEIGGYTYEAYDILTHADDDNYTELKRDFCVSMNEDDESEARWSLEHAEDGEHIEIQGYTVICYEENLDESPEAAAQNTELLTTIRTFIEDQKILDAQRKLTEQKDEDDLMKVFQVIE